jgi:hypothetical protein
MSGVKRFGAFQTLNYALQEIIFCEQTIAFDKIFKVLIENKEN